MFLQSKRAEIKNLAYKESEKRRFDIFSNGVLGIKVVVAEIEVQEWYLQRLQLQKLKGNEVFHG